MLKGFLLTPPIIGRLSIGKVINKDGKRLPAKDDEFTLTSQIQTKDGWRKHPLDEQLRKNTEGKLRVIPIRLLFNDPDLNFRAQYCLFDRTSGRPVCVGDGESCRRLGSDDSSLICPSPSLCELGQNSQCKPYGRLNVRIGDEDELGSFIFRTTGFNSIRTLMSRLRYFDAVSNHLLATLPLVLRLRGKSSIQSFRSTIYYVDLTLPDQMTLNEAIQIAKVEDEKRKASGFNQQALDATARLGFNAGVFEDTEEDGGDVVEEFYGVGGGDADIHYVLDNNDGDGHNQSDDLGCDNNIVVKTNNPQKITQSSDKVSKPSLAQKLAQKTGHASTASIS